TVHGPVLAIDGDLVCLGQRPRNGDRLVRLAGQPTPTFVHFNRRLSQLPSVEAQTLAAAPAGLEEVLRGTPHSLVDIAGQRWVRIDFLRADEVQPPGREAAERQPLLSGWLRLTP